jgi:hypothetical protein
VTTTGAPERKRRGLGLFRTAVAPRGGSWWCGIVRALAAVRAPAAIPERAAIFASAVLLALAALLVGTAPLAAAPRSRPSFGPDMVHRIGVGMMSPETPLGVRYLFSHRTGFEVGLGMNTVDLPGVDGTDVRLEGGLLLAMAPGHRVSFYLRPGIGFTSEHRTAGAYSTVGLSVGFSFEWFVTRDFSLTAAQSLRLDLVSPPKGDPAGSGDRTRLGVFGSSVPHFGFFYYLPER